MLHYCFLKVSRNYSAVLPLLIFVIALFLPSSVEASWEILELPHFFIHYQPIDKRVVQALTAQADNIYQTITEDVGYVPQAKTFVYLCPTPECFRQKQPASVKLPDWAVGVAYPSLNRIVMRSALTAEEKGYTRGSIKPVEIFKHEFAHIILEQALEKQGGAPRWLSEGFSMYHAKQWTISGQRTIEEVTLRDDFIPLTMLTAAFPSDEEAARIAYAQSFSLVSFMLNTYGKPVFRKFIKNLREGMDTNAALFYSTGRDLTQLEREWQTYLKKRYTWFSYFINNIGLFWFILSVSFVIIYLVKRYKMKRIQERWEEEEEMNIDWTDTNDLP